MNTIANVAENRPFGKPSNVKINRDFLSSLPIECPAFRARAHHMTMALDAPPEFIVATLLAAHSLLLAHRGYNIEPLWFWLLGDNTTGRFEVMNLMLDWLSETFRRQGEIFEGDRPPLIQADASTVQGILGALPRYWNQNRNSTVAMVYGEDTTHIFGVNPLYTCLTNLIAGRSHQPERRELQRGRGSRLAEEAIINPRIGGLLSTTVDMATSTTTPLIIETGLLHRIMIVYGQVSPDTVVHDYMPDMFQAEDEAAYDAEFQLFFQQDMDYQMCGTRTITYDQDVIDYCTDLKRHALGADTVRERLILLAAKDQAKRLAKVYAALLGYHVVNTVIFNKAYYYALYGAAGLSTLEAWINTNEIVRKADKVENWLQVAGVRGLTRREISKRLKTDSLTLNNVIQILRDDRRSAIEMPVESKYGTEKAYYDAEAAPTEVLQQRKAKEEIQKFTE